MHGSMLLSNLPMALILAEMKRGLFRIYSSFMPRRSVSSVKGNVIKPKGETIPSEPDSVKESIGDLRAEADRQEEEAQRYAIAFLKKVMRLKGVAIERDHFLRSEFRKRGVSGERVELAISTSPAAAGMDSGLVDSIAMDVIDFETKKSSVLSFSAGLPGGLAMLGTIPADVTQYYVHAIRIMQKLAYLYGWQSFIDDCDEMDDETLAAFALLLAVMVGVSGANSALTAFSKTVQSNVAKKVANKALMNTSYYPIIKKVLTGIGVKVTKSSFGDAVSKVVPVIGGFVSGGLTFFSLKNGSKRLAVELRSLPQATDPVDTEPTGSMTDHIVMGGMIGDDDAQMA